MMEWELKHAQEAIDCGIYVTWQSDATKQECFRVGSSSKCFCGHLFSQHEKKLGKS